MHGATNPKQSQLAGSAAVQKGRTRRLKTAAGSLWPLRTAEKHRVTALLKVPDVRNIGSGGGDRHRRLAGIKRGAPAKSFLNAPVVTGRTLAGNVAPMPGSAGDAAGRLLRRPDHGGGFSDWSRRGMIAVSAGGRVDWYVRTQALDHTYGEI